jgi:hypothetical protein
MHQGEERCVDGILAFTNANSNAEIQLNNESAHEVVVDLIRQIRSGNEIQATNVSAVLASLSLAAAWLSPNPDVVEKLSETYKAVGEVVRSNVEFDWLFETGGEPRMELISAEVFEVLIELRVLADRLQQAGAIG